MHCRHQHSCQSICTDWWIYGSEGHIFTLPMLRLLSSKAQGRKEFWKPSKPSHIGIHWKEIPEFSQMSTHVPGIQVLGYLHHFVSGKLATSSIKVVNSPSKGLAGIQVFHNLFLASLSGGLAKKWQVLQNLEHYRMWPQCQSSWPPH